jgi:hypothetical protein
VSQSTEGPLADHASPPTGLLSVGSQQGAAWSLRARRFTDTGPCPGAIAVCAAKRRRATLSAAEKPGVAPRGSPFCTANSIGSCRDWLNPSPQPRIAYSGVEEVGGTVIASSDYDEEGCGLSRIKSPTSAPSPVQPERMSCKLGVDRRNSPRAKFVSAENWPVLLGREGGSRTARAPPEECRRQACFTCLLLSLWACLCDSFFLSVRLAL